MFETPEGSYLSDRTLSLRAKGLLAIMLSLGSTVKSIAPLMEMSGVGRSGIYTVLSELKSAGYVTSQVGRLPNGWVRNHWYTCRATKEARS